MKSLLLIFLSFSIYNLAMAQPVKLIKGGQINLPPKISDKINANEFSSLGRWNNNVLLIPALKQQEWDIKRTCIYAIHDSIIDKSRLDKAYSIPDSEVKEIFFQPESFQKVIGSIKEYDRIEATVVGEGGDIFFSIETRGNHECYIIRGSIVEYYGKTTIYLFENIPPKKIVKENYVEKDVNNGYEALAFLPNSKTLIAIYEKKGDKTLYYKIGLKSTLLSKNYFKSLNNKLRVTDVFAKDDSTLISISSKIGLYQIHKIDLQSNKSYLIATLDSRKYESNWEGILPFKNGVLLINDNCDCSSKDKKGDGPSNLVYFPVTY